MTAVRSRLTLRTDTDVTLTTEERHGLLSMLGAVSWRSWWLVLPGGRLRLRGVDRLSQWQHGMGRAGRNGVVGLPARLAVQLLALDTLDQGRTA